MIYEKNMKEIWDEYATRKRLEEEHAMAMEEAKELGMEKGMEIGIEKGREQLTDEVIRNFL